MEKILLDSHVFLDYLLHSEKEKHAEKLITDITNGKSNGVVSTITLAEVKYRMQKIAGHDKAETAMFLIKDLPNTEIISVNSNIAETAADVRFKYYKKKEREISYADSIQVATAMLTGCTLIVSGDLDFKGIEEVKTEVY